jgi:hypothetical protein
MNDPDLEQLLRRARGIAPRAGSKDRLRSRALAVAAAGGVGTVAAHAVGASKASAWGVALGKGGAGLWLSVLTCVGGGVVVGLLVVGPVLTSHGRAPMPRSADSTTAAEASAPAAPAVPSSTATPPTRENIVMPLAVPSYSASAQPRVPSIERETALLAEAQRALRRADAAAALGFLDVYEREFPGGALAEEALAARIVGLCSLRRKAEGLRALAKFRAAHSDSPLLARVATACGNVASHDDFELESASPSTQSGERAAPARATGRESK